MKHRHIFLLLMITGLISLSCAPMLETVSVPSERPRAPEELRPSLEGEEQEFGVALPEEVKTVKEGQPPCEPKDDQTGLGIQERRFRSYQEKLIRWQAVERQMNILGFPDRPSGWHQCLDAVRSLHDRYNIWLRQAEKGKSGGEGGSPSSMAGIWGLLEWDITYLESGCDATMEAGSDGLAGWVNQITATIAGQAPAGEAGSIYFQTDALVTAARQLHSSLPEREQLPESQRLFGLSLLQSGQLESAANVLSGIEGTPLLGSEEVALRLKVADLLLSVGRVDEARRSYAMLDRFFSRLHGLDRWVADQRDILETIDVRSNTFAVFLAVMRAYLVFDGQRVPVELSQGVRRLEKEAPGSLLARRGRMLLNMAEEKAGGWVHQRLLEVDNLVEARKSGQAVVILENMAGRADLDPDQQALVSEALDKVRQVQSMEQETNRMMQEQELSIFYENGINLFEQSQFDESIAVFSGLLGTNYDAQAREKIVEASDFAVKRVRRQASLLFIEARRVADPDRKRALLLESWEALKSIETKYPNSTLLGKVRDNRSYLENYIMQSDPTLLGVEGSTEAPPQSSESGEVEEEILD